MFGTYACDWRAAEAVTTATLWGHWFKFLSVAAMDSVPRRAWSWGGGFVRVIIDAGQSAFEHILPALADARIGGEGDDGRHG